jgi:hypothetical protein
MRRLLLACGLCYLLLAGCAGQQDQVLSTGHGVNLIPDAQERGTGKSRNP